MVNIAIIISSTRPNRFGPTVAAWLASLAQNSGSATFTTIDLAEVGLPMFDEPTPPLIGKYHNAHTKAWAKTIASYDGFIIVTPEYNHGYPAAIKNALDFLYAEWNFKPVAFVSYGAGAGGARAVEQLRQVVIMLSMFNLVDHVSFVNYQTQVDEDGALKPNDRQISAAKELLANITFWSTELKAARAKLAAQKAQR